MSSDTLTLIEENDFLQVAMRRVSYLLSIFFGAGLVKGMPGTVASLASLIIWAPLVLLETHWLSRFACIGAIFLLGWWATHASQAAFHGQDPKEVVIDEVAGMGLALLFCQPTWQMIFIGFMLFRVFDIVKPWPISWVDRKIKGPLGVMLDDMLAGAAAGLVLNNPFLTSQN